MPLRLIIIDIFNESCLIYPAKSIASYCLKYKVRYGYKPPWLYWVLKKTFAIFHLNNFLPH